MVKSVIWKIMNFFRKNATLKKRAKNSVWKCTESNPEKECL